MRFVQVEEGTERQGKRTGGRTGQSYRNRSVRRGGIKVVREVVDVGIDLN